MIIGVIVTYNPDLVQLVGNVSRIKPQVDKLVIYDNASENILEMLSNDIIMSNDVIRSEYNVGLGSAYNEVINKYKYEYEYLATFDQDTKIGLNLIKSLISILEDSSVAIAGPCFDAKARSDVSQSDVQVLIQSGSVYRMKIFEDIGNFKSDYFIDSVDFEFCLRARKNGYRVVMSNTDYIEHSLGIKKKYFCINYVSHSEFRNYYISRNHVRLSVEYFNSFPLFIIKKNVFFILHLMKLILLERNIKSIASTINGIMNGFYHK